MKRMVLGPIPFCKFCGLISVWKDECDECEEKTITYVEEKLKKYEEEKLINQIRDEVFKDEMV